MRLRITTLGWAWVIASILWCLMLAFMVWEDIGRGHSMQGWWPVIIAAAIVPPLTLLALVRGFKWLFRARR
jgi:hypothetical protein